jgi:hypothetical protein
MHTILVLQNDSKGGGIISWQHTTNNKKITLKTRKITNQIMVAEKRRSRNNGIDNVNII